jgi:5-methylcytosine-specific restriction endonuclease McrA
MSFECPSCDSSFDNKTGMKVHHSKIHGESIAGELVNCEYCGEELRRSPSDVQNQENFFCDYDCMSSWQSDNWSGKESPRSTLKEVECHVCNDEILRPKWRLDKHEKFLCSEECRGIMMSDLHYEGGYRRDNGKLWKRMKTKTREKYDHSCQKCGERCGEIHHDVHHIVPIAEFEDASDANKEENLTLLCRNCHKPVEVNWSTKEQFEKLT